MSIRHVCSAALCLFMSVAAAYGQGASNLFDVPGPSNASNRTLGYNAYSNPLQSFLDAPGTANAYRVIPTPGGAKFYVITPTGIQATNANLAPQHAVPVAGTVRNAVVSPDGNYLLVVANHFYIVATATDTILATDPGFIGNAVDVTVSHDSKTAWVVYNIGAGGFLVSINLTSRTLTASLGRQFPLNAVSQSPKGLLYVSYQGGLVDEVDPATLSLTSTGTINLPDPNAAPGPLRFTPDGSTAYFVNLSPTPNTGSLLKMNLTTHAVSVWPPTGSNSVPTLSDVFIGGNTQIYTYSPADTTLWDVTPSPFSVGISTVPVTSNLGFDATHVLSAAVSDEVPSSRFLFVLVNEFVRTGLYRVDLSSGLLSTSTEAPVAGVLQFAPVPPQTGASSFSQINSSQALLPGATSLPLIARVLNGLARPVFNQAVTFSADAGSGIVIANPSQVTGSDGWVQTTVTAPSTPGTYNVTLTAGQATTMFSITVVGGSGLQQLSIVDGDGQLIPEVSTTSFFHPLTVLARDALGAPLPGVAVSFAVTDGLGQTQDATVTTDDAGLAHTTFFSGVLPPNVFAFEESTVTASSGSGTVTFHVTTFHQNFGGTGLPIISLLTPASRELTIGQGDVVSNAITVSILANNIPQFNVPIPDVGLRLGSWPDANTPGPLSCQGPTGSDNLGVAHCNVVAACQIGSFDTSVNVGELGSYRITVNITQGHAQTAGVVSGNNQSGHPGNVLALLVARFTDGCNNAVAGTGVTWTVTQGSATLSQASTTTAGDGSVTARVTLGATPGPVTVLVSSTTGASVAFQLTNSILVSGINLFSGGGQTASINTPFASPVVFFVHDSNNNPVAGAVVSLAVNNGAGISPSSATTGADGKVQATVTAGANTGTLTVTAANGNFNATASLTVRPPTLPLTSSSFVNAASFAPGLAPCGLASVFGSGLAPNINGLILGNTFGFGPWPYTLGGLSITVNQLPAPIQAVANMNGTQQVNFQVPCEVNPGTATIVVSVGGTNTPVNVQIAAAAPGIFTFAGSNNKNYGIVISASDGSYVTSQNPAHRGSNYFLVVTGLGQTNPGAITNSSAVANQTVNAPVVVGVNNGGVPTNPAQYLVGSTGVYLVPFSIPSDFVTGADLPLAMFAVVNGNIVFGNSVLLPAVN